jgi:hypothetical protein
VPNCTSPVCQHFPLARARICNPCVTPPCLGGHAGQGWWDELPSTAPLAWWTRRRASNPKIAGSSPAGRVLCIRGHPQWGPAGLTWWRSHQGQARPSQAQAHACCLFWPGTTPAAEAAGCAVQGPHRATTQVRLRVWICLGASHFPVSTRPFLNDCRLIQLSLSSAVLLHPLRQRRPNHGSVPGEKKNKEKRGRQTHECLTFRRHDPPDPCDGSRACV